MGAGISKLERTPPYLPFLDGPAKVAPQLKPISAANWLLPDVEADWIPAKRRLLVSDTQNVFALPEEFRSEAQKAGAAALEALNLPSDMNAAFHVASENVSDDLCVMVESDGFYRLGAACLCAPTFWSLPEMLGKPLGGLHHNVPGGDPKLASRISRIFKGLQPGMILERFNWTVQLDSEKYTPSSQPMKQALKALSAQQAANRLHLRVERQTIQKLPQSSSVLFTIRISTDLLSPILKDKGTASTFFKNWDATDQALAGYKGWPVYQPAVDWLRLQN